ncbi:MAG: hypothetical protein RR954_09540 [Christensenellaceae bacterium]
MDWTTIFQDTISGIMVASFCGIVGWIVYLTGIKGKEKNQIASERKREIYIPLKYELDNVVHLKDTVWQNVEIKEITKVVRQNDELVVTQDIYDKCCQLSQLVSRFNNINLYCTTGNILSKRFEEKYLELYGSTTHTVTRWEESAQEEIEYDETDPELYDFASTAEIKENVDRIFKFDRGMIEYYDETDCVSPLEDYLTVLFGSVLPKKEKKYNGIKFENLSCPALIEKRISPAEYIAKDFAFLDVFENHKDVKEKAELLTSIKALAFELYENVVIRIRFIGKKYESE